MNRGASRMMLIFALLLEMGKMMNTSLVRIALVSAFTGLLAGLLGSSINSLLWTATVHAQSPQKVTLRELNLFDDAGTIRTTITTSQDGTVRLNLNNSLGRPVVALGVTEDGQPIFGITDNTQQARFVLSTSGDTTELTINDKNGRSRVTLGVNSDDEAIVRVADKATKGGVLMMSEAVGGSAISVWDLEGTKRISAATTADPMAVLSVQDSKGQGRALLGTTQSDTAIMGVLDPKGDALWGYGQ